MRDGMGMDAAACGAVFSNWNEGALQSYLVEISGKVATATDEKTSKAVLDIILDRAGQKGTGRWTAVEAQHLAAAIPVIEAAVTARNLSAQLDERKKGEAIFGAGPTSLSGDDLSLEDLEAALIAGKIMCYAQGFGLLNAAAASFGWDLPMPAIANVWREGCIIRSSRLTVMSTAVGEAPGENLMLAPFFTALISANEAQLRHVVATCVSNGLPVPALSAAVSYFDIMRTGRSTANMIQGQRDFFGAHSFERTDEEGAHHGPWAMN
jgi:6-phosphogluconate dehydrogenase